MDRSIHARDALLVGVLLAAVTMAAYWPVFQNGFVSYDDRTYVTENPYLRGALTGANVAWAFQTGYAGNWHPLTWLSHLLDVQLFDLRPRWHHFTSLLFHTANTLLLWVWLRRMTGAFWRSTAVAALFALHPLHVESVAWVAERKDVLSAFFFLLTLLAYGRYAAGQSLESRVLSPESSEHPRTTHHAPRSTLHASGFYLLSLGCFALGLMSKPMLVTVPFVLLLLDFWPLRRLQRGRARWLMLEKLPYLALSLASSVATFLIQRGAGAVSSLDTLPLEFRISNALVSYLRYAAKMVWPTHLAVFYPPPSQWSDAWLAAAILVLAGVSAVALWRARAAPYVPVGWFWYVGMLVPVIGLVQVGQQAMADRYSYLPLIGLFILIVWCAAELGVLWPAARRPMAIGFAVAIAACGVLTWRQAGYWRTSTSLFEHALAVTRDNAVAQNNLGVCLLDAGNVAAAEGRFTEALRIRPAYPEALVNLGSCREKAGQEQEALALFQRSLQVQETPVGHYNLANLLSKHGAVGEAEAHYRAALKARPEFAECWYNLGLLKSKQDRMDEAAECYATALRLRPGLSEAHEALGGILLARKNVEGAIEHYRAALAIAPNSADGHFNLAAALNAKGDFPGAAAHYAEACRLRPDDVDARRNLGLVLLSQGKLPEAAARFQEVLKMHPNAATEHDLALVLDAQGQPEAALVHYREAVRLAPNAALYVNDLAWVLATSPKPELRDGPQAVHLAEAAIGLTGGKEPRCFGTLDAAYAEVGRFADAVATATKAHDLALAAGQPGTAQQAQARLELYRAGKPYRAPAVQAPQQ